MNITSLVYVRIYWLIFSTMETAFSDQRFVCRVKDEQNHLYVIIIILIIIIKARTRLVWKEPSFAGPAVQTSRRWPGLPLFSVHRVLCVGARAWSRIPRVPGRTWWHSGRPRVFTSLLQPVCRVGVRGYAGRECTLSWTSTNVERAERDLSCRFGVSFDPGQQ